MFSYPNLHSRDPLLVGRSQSKELSSELQCNASLDAVLESVTRDSHVQNLATVKTWRMWQKGSALQKDGNMATFQ